VKKFIFNVEILHLFSRGYVIKRNACGSWGICCTYIDTVCNRKLWCRSLWCCGAGGADNDFGAGADDETGDGVIVQVTMRVFIVVQVIILVCGGVCRARDDNDAGDY
jgi:hypothetical protein